MSIESYLVLAVSVFIAALIQGISGFAFAMILLGILPHVLGYTQALALTSILAVFLMAANAWNYRKHVVWNLLPAAIFSYIIGTRIGIQILAYISDSAVLGRLLGIFLMLWVVYQCIENRQVTIKPTVLNGFLWGGVGGLMGGLFGMAPILVFYFLAVTKDKESYMGCTQMFFFIGICFDVLFRSQMGMITFQILQLAGFSFLFLLLGFGLGRMILQHISMLQLQKIIYGFIFLCGMMLLFV